MAWHDVPVCGIGAPLPDTVAQLVVPSCALLFDIGIDGNKTHKDCHRQWKGLKTRMWQESLHRDSGDRISITSVNAKYHFLME